MWKKQGSWNFFHAKLIPNSSNNMYFCTKFNKRIRDSLLNKQILKGYL